MDILSYAIGKAAGGGVTPTPPDLIDLEATENGTYTHSGHDGYDEVTVNVANSYSASDEGKVVSSGALVSQTSTTKNANGTYDTTTNNEVVVSVPNSYAAADEGKVVQSGALVSQTSATKTINGTYDTTTNNEIVVDVPNPSTGKVNITTTSEVNVTNYAAAQVTDSDLVAGNIKKDVNILGVTGTYEGSGGGGITEGMVFTYDNSTSSRYNDRINKVDVYWDSNKQYDNWWGSSFEAAVPAAGSSALYANLSTVELHNYPYKTPSALSDTITVPPYFVNGYTTLKNIIGYNLLNKTVVGTYAFSSCGHMGKWLVDNIINKNSGFTEFKNNCFEGNNLNYSPEGSFVTELQMPSTLLTCGANLFRNWKKITDIYFNSTPTTLSNQAFTGFSTETDIYVPWSEGDVAGAPWGATNVTIHYDYTPTP